MNHKLSEPDQPNAPEIQVDGKPEVFPQEPVTIISMPSGQHRLYGPEEVIQKALERVQEKGFDMVIEGPEPCV
jgi:hypothetical protein